MSKRFSPSVDRNRDAILAQLSTHLKYSQQLLEIGSGTGQHAVFFASQLSHLRWHTSDMPENHPSINAWIKESAANNIYPPRSFTIGQDDWPVADIDAVFTANTTHIMQPSEAKQMMEIVASNLAAGGIFCQYGPMKVAGDYTSESNKAFDQTLKQKGFGGIRGIEQLVGWAKGLVLVESIPMPANNFLLIWHK